MQKEKVLECVRKRSLCKVTLVQRGVQVAFEVAEEFLGRKAVGGEKDLTEESFEAF